MSQLLGGLADRNEQNNQEGGEAIEGVPNILNTSESGNLLNVNEAKENRDMKRDDASRTIGCSSLEENADTVINTIEVTGDELMDMGQEISGEVEFIYTPSNVQYQGEENNVEQNHVEVDLQELEENSNTNFENVRNISRVKIPDHLILQRYVKGMILPSGSLAEFDQGSSRSNYVLLNNDDTSNVTVSDPAFPSDVTVLQRVQEMPYFSTINDVTLTIDGKPVQFDTPTSGLDSNKAATRTEYINRHSNIILAADVQGLEQQIPIIVKTATLAQKTINAALTVQPIFIPSGNPNPQNIACVKSLVRGRDKRDISSNPNPTAKSSTTVQVEVSEGTCVQMKKYFCQAGLCRICLLVKENLTSLFEDVSIDSHGMVENSRGPNASKQFHLLPAIKTLLDIEIELNDGLPDMICMTCYDELMNFSVYRKRIAIGQTKLNQVLEQVKDSNTPTFIPSLGEMDIEKTDIYKNTTSVLTAKSLLKNSKYSHVVSRNLSDRLWDKIFSSFSSIVGYNSGKLKDLEHFTCELPYVNGFFCYTCNSTILGSKDNFAQHHYDFHDIISHENVLYPCDICGNSYGLKGKSNNYAEHWLQHFFLHECTLCNIKLPSSKGLWVHKKSVHVHKDKIFACDEPNCGKKFHKKAYLNAHKRIHADSNFDIAQADKVLCATCNKRFSTPGSLAVHLATVHEKDRPWKCDIDGCQASFKRKEILNSHKKSVHMNVHKYVCEICGERFKSLSSINVHALVHKGEKRHNCSVCSKQFYSPNGLKSHMVKHQNVGHFQCNECSKVFKRSAYLEEHKRTHTGEKPFICPVCSRAIRMKSNYFKHMRIHKRKNEIQ